MEIDPDFLRALRFQLSEATEYIDRNPNTCLRGWQIVVADSKTMLAKLDELLKPAKAKTE